MFLSDKTMTLLIESGLPPEKLVEILQSLRADEEAATPVRSGAARRQAKYRERKASQPITEHNAVTVGDESDAKHNADPLSRPLPPQTPLTPTHSPGDLTTRARGVAAKPNGFARFWEAYPNKTGKLAAEKAYAKALKAIPGPDPPGLILAGVERAKASRQWIEGYVPHPTTWLNRGSWDDEPETPQPRKAHDRTASSPDRRQDAFRERLGDIASAMAASVEQSRREH